MKQWVPTDTVDVTKLEGVVSAKFGGSLLFVYYFKLGGWWEWVYPGGAEKIAEPPLLYLEEEWARTNRSLSATCKYGSTEKSLAIRRKKCEQMMLF